MKCFITSGPDHIKSLSIFSSFLPCFCLTWQKHKAMSSNNGVYLVYILTPVLSSLITVSESFRVSYQYFLSNHLPAFVIVDLHLSDSLGTWMNTHGTQPESQEKTEHLCFHYTDSTVHPLLIHKIIIRL